MIQVGKNPSEKTEWTSTLDTSEPAVTALRTLRTTGSTELHKKDEALSCVGKLQAKKKNEVPSLEKEYCVCLSGTKDDN